jgi:uncharacterized protein (TIGR00290 family)
VALDIPVIEVKLPPRPGNAEYEAAFARGLEEVGALHPHLDRIAFGDLFLQDVREYRDTLLARLGWRGVYPLWQRDTMALARYFVGIGYRAVLTCVDTTQLDASFAGREFDAALLDDLPGSVDPCGERGEFHTFVYQGPIFGSAVGIRAGERVLRDERFAYCDLISA